MPSANPYVYGILTHTAGGRASLTSTVHAHTDLPGPDRYAAWRCVGEDAYIWGKTSGRTTTTARCSSLFISVMHANFSKRAWHHANTHVRTVLWVMNHESGSSRFNLYSFRQKGSRDGPAKRFLAGYLLRNPGWIEGSSWSVRDAINGLTALDPSAV